MALYKLNEGQKDTIKEFFKKHSSNGLMTKEDITTVLKRYGITPTDKELQAMIHSISLNENGISLEAFMCYVANEESPSDKKHEYMEAFRAFDLDGDGTISKDEVRYMMMLMGLTINWTTLMAEVDRDGDGKIDYEEFCDMMNKL